MKRPLSNPTPRNSTRTHRPTALQLTTKKRLQQHPMKVNRLLKEHQVKNSTPTQHHRQTTSPTIMPVHLQCHTHLPPTLILQPLRYPTNPLWLSMPRACTRILHRCPTMNRNTIRELRVSEEVKLRWFRTPLQRKRPSRTQNRIKSISQWNMWGQLQ